MVGKRVAQLVFLLLLPTAATLGKFYIYENFPPNITNSWPDHYIEDTRLSFLEKFKRNYGIGPVVDSSSDMFHSHQYSIFWTILNRLRTSSLRTRNPEEASIFFIPYDLGMDATTRKSDGWFVQTLCPRMEAAHALLKQSKYFQKRGGKDHVMIHSINQLMLYHANVHCLSIYKTCLQCTKLGIDAFPKAAFRELQKLDYLRERWVSIPFPSNHHRKHPLAINTKDYKSLQERKNSMIHRNRWYTIAYIGSDKVVAKKQKALRKAIREACYSDTDPIFGSRRSVSITQKCLVVNMGRHDSLAPAIFWEDPLKRNTLTSPYSRALFCLMPGGDYPSRKAILDALQAGCIPVLFELEAAAMLWPWHWGTFQRAMDCMIYVPRIHFMKNPSETLELLIEMSRQPKFVQAKQRCIQYMLSRLQYSPPLTKYAIPIYPRKYLGNDSIDAIDVLLSRLL